MSEAHQPFIDQFYACRPKDQELKDVLTYLQQFMDRHSDYYRDKDIGMHVVCKIPELYELLEALHAGKHRGTYVRSLRRAKTFEELIAEGKSYIKNNKIRKGGRIHKIKTPEELTARLEQLKKSKHQRN
jgi:hypothetical protein